MRPTYVGIDAGGSHTSACLSVSGEEVLVHGPSLNPASIGAAAAVSGWTELLARIAAVARPETLVGWIGAARCTRSTLAGETEALRVAADASGLRGRLALTNDLVPLLLGPPLWGHGIVVAVGTGSSVLGRHRSGRTVRLGGHEYLLSDEGGGFDIGLRGLRAAARAYDGRGPATCLVESVADAYGSAVPELGHEIAQLPFPKGEVSRFARYVCDAWVAGDAVAGTIVAGSIEELVACAARVGSLLGPGAGMPTVVTGSIAVGCAPYLAEMRTRLEAVGLVPVDEVLAPERVSCVLARSGRELGESSSDHLPRRWVSFGAGAGAGLGARLGAGLGEAGVRIGP